MCCDRLRAREAKQDKRDIAEERDCSGQLVISPNGLIGLLQLLKHRNRTDSE